MMLEKRLTRIIQKIDSAEQTIKRKIYYKMFGIPPRPMIKYIKENNSENNELVGVEIGTYHGDNALSMLLNLPIKKIYLIDPYLNYGGYTDKYGDELSLEPVFNVAKEKLSKFKDKVAFIRKMSSDAISDIPDNVDFVYIDGNHKYEYVKQDMEMYYDKVKLGGGY